MRSNPSTVDTFFASLLSAQLPPGFQDFRAASDQLQKSSISLGLAEAGLLRMLVGLHGGSKWVEIGTLTGFSGFCLVEALPKQAHLWTFEKDPRFAEQARRLFTQKRLASRVTLVEGDAALTLDQIEEQGPFDGIFIDGNKGAYGIYLDWAEKNLRPGSLIIADNIFLGNALWEGPSDQTPWSVTVIKKMHDFINRMMNPDHYQATIVPTSEGLLVAKKL